MRLSSLKVGRDKLLQHFRRRHTDTTTPTLNNPSPSSSTTADNSRRNSTPASELPELRGSCTATGRRPFSLVIPRTATPEEVDIQKELLADECEERRNRTTPTTVTTIVEPPPSTAATGSTIDAISCILGPKGVPPEKVAVEVEQVEEVEKVEKIQEVAQEVKKVTEVKEVERAGVREVEKTRTGGERNGGKGAGGEEKAEEIEGEERVEARDEKRVTVTEDILRAPRPVRPLLPLLPLLPGEKTESQRVRESEGEKERGLNKETGTGTEERETAPPATPTAAAAAAATASTTTTTTPPPPPLAAVTVISNPASSAAFAADSNTPTSLLSSSADFPTTTPSTSAACAAVTVIAAVSSPALASTSQNRVVGEDQEGEEVKVEVEKKENDEQEKEEEEQEEEEEQDQDQFTPQISPSSSISTKPTPLARRQSLFPSHHIAHITTNLLKDKNLALIEEPPAGESHQKRYRATEKQVRQRYQPEMPSSKVWVRRRDASPTLVNVHQDDLVDNLRDAILKKYQNGLGRYYDAPDILLKITPRGRGQREERPLNPEDLVVRVLDEYYPGGQTVAEALIIEVPQLRDRKTPRPSPSQPSSYYVNHGHDSLHGIEGNEYFPPMPPPSSTHPANQATPSLNNPQHGHSQGPMAILAGPVSSVPASPGTGAGAGSGARKGHRPPLRNRPPTSSPTALSTAVSANAPNAPFILQPRGARVRTTKEANVSGQNKSSPALTNSSTGGESSSTTITSPPARVTSPRPTKSKREQKGGKSNHGGLLDGTVPPINVLIVEDNSINLKLLEAFMKRLKVRWQSAMNGKEAVVKWRAGGFHLVLMDIQLPIMSGLEATKEIRRLERVNRIGAFPQAPGAGDDESSAQQEVPETVAAEDKLSSSIVFKWPVIIVALTASSLQKDRHEALAAGCNDFLTKPVNFVWLEKKVMEWGCMQALIDFDNWKKWKESTQNSGEDGTGPGNKGKRQGPGRKDKQRTGGLTSPTALGSPSLGSGDSLKAAITN